MLRHWLFNKVQGVKKRLGLPVFNPAAAFGHSDPIGSSDLNRMFADHDGRLVHKWTQYLDLYDRHLASRRGTAVRMLEIGVALGGSLDLWRK